MTAPIVVDFDHELASKHSLVGGKGANLGKLSQAGFRVPPGFTVTVNAYGSFLQSTGLEDTIAACVANLPEGDADQLEEQTAALRAMIVETPMPESVAAAVTSAYRELGDDPYVAVRSSGTAEDLADASFAGLHDTILGVKGIDEVLTAVKACWASMWSARATSYRKTKGFEHGEASIAVVVQRLVDSDTAGVLFTGNPMTASTEEYVVNASWGLGESVVSGVITPDQFVIRAKDFGPRERTPGAKALKILRDPQTGQGTRIEQIPADEQLQLCLSDDQLAELGTLGRDVTRYYDYIPQDIEWAFCDGTLYLLQSRPITGVEFSWDEEVDGWQTASDSDDYVWSRSWADEVWTGAITPLMYSWRGMLYTRFHEQSHRLWGREDTARMQLFRFHKSEAYENANIERLMITRAHPMARPGLTAHVPPQWRDEALAAPFSYLDYLKTHARIFVLEPSAGLFRWVKVQYADYINNAEQIELANGLTPAQLTRLSDRELMRYIDEKIDHERRYFQDMWTGFFIHARDAMSLLATMLNSWYDGENTMAFTDVISGVSRPTFTIMENHQLWELTQQIRWQPTLRAALERYEGAEFFEHLNGSAEGRDFLADYEMFLKEYGHRGAADRDIYNPRRIEDPSIDYSSFRALISAPDDADPKRKDDEIAQRRAEVTEEVLANIRRKPLGGLKAEAFRVVLSYVQEFLMYRDNERHFTDRITWGGKKGLLELNRRLIERGQVQSDRDYFFLTRDELFAHFEGRSNEIWTRAKIAGRAANFDRFLARDYTPPMYMQAGKAVMLEEADTDPNNLIGMGTSRGKVTGTARIVKSLSEVGRVREGEILITNATDPGWTPVFMIIKGIVLETGGMLAHGSCLAREYGLPATQLGDAMKRIPDGATITMDGEAGTISIHSEDPSDASDTATDAVAVSV
jgi:rifampicin phosphotransferase